jgi:hypothetical protein
MMALRAADALERTEAETLLRESETRLKVAMSAGKFGNCELSLSEFNLTASPHARRTSG